VTFSTENGDGTLLRKRWLLPTNPYGGETQKNVIKIVIAVKILSLTTLSFAVLCRGVAIKRFRINYGSYAAWKELRTIRKSCRGHFQVLWVFSGRT
jgi:hypothetical protein